LASGIHASGKLLSLGLALNAEVSALAVEALSWMVGTTAG